MNNACSKCGGMMHIGVASAEGLLHAAIEMDYVIDHLNEVELPQ